MADLKLNDSHDLEFVDNDFSLTLTESESLAQRLVIKLRTYQEEFFLDQTLGIPWHQFILRKNVSKETIDNLMKRAILTEPEVLQIQSFESSIDTRYRIYNLSFRVLSSNADEPIPVELSIGDT